MRVDHTQCQYRDEEEHEGAAAADHHRAKPTARPPTIQMQVAFLLFVVFVVVIALGLWPCCQL